MRRLLAVVVVLAIAPGLSEFVETAVHYAKHGDLADSVDDRHDVSPLGVREHGCAGMFHVGRCKNSQLATTAQPVVVVMHRGTPSSPSVSSVALLCGLSASAPELRPPIS